LLLGKEEEVKEEATLAFDKAVENLVAAFPSF
jgi:hypothetical protein